MYAAFDFNDSRKTCMNPPVLTNPQLRTLHAALLNCQQTGQSLGNVVPVFRQQQALLQALPPAFAPALEGILERIEAGALFTEESCSFSQSDLVAALEVWLQKANQRLDSHNT